MTARPLRGNLRKKYLQTKDLLFAAVVVKNEAARLRAIRDVKQAALLDDAASGLHRRIELECQRTDAAQRAKRGRVSALWFSYIAENIAGVPEFAAWFAGGLPVLSDKYLRTTKHVLIQFDEWLTKRKKKI